METREKGGEEFLIQGAMKACITMTAFSRWRGNALYFFAMRGKKKGETGSWGKRSWTLLFLLGRNI